MNLLDKIKAKRYWSLEVEINFHYRKHRQYKDVISKDYLYLE